MEFTCSAGVDTILVLWAPLRVMKDVFRLICVSFYKWLLVSV